MATPIVPGPGFRPRPIIENTRISLPTKRRLEGDRIRLTLRSGPRIINKFVVRELIGSEDSLLVNALRSAEVPQLGDVHPVVAGAIVGLIEAEHLPASPTQALVTVEYGFFAEDDFVDDNDIPPSQSLQVSSTVQPDVTNFDHQGNPIILEHTTDPALGPPEVLGPPQTAEVEFQLPMPTVTFRRREDSNPLSKAVDFVGSINSEPLDEGRLPMHMVMCTRMDGVTEDRGVTYMVTYEFQINPDSWNVTVIYRDQTGLPIGDPVEGISIKRNVQIHRALDFTRLELFV